MMKQSLSVLFLLASSWVWGAQPSGAQVSSLTGLLAPKQDLHLGPGAERSYSLAVPPGQVVSVTFEQTVGMVQVRWLPEGLSPEARNQMDQRVNRSGRHAAILFRSIGWTHSEGQPTTGTFVVQNQSKRAAEVRILTGAARQASVDDGKIAQAEADTAHAVALSANRTPANLKASLELLQSAEQQWRYFKDSADAHVELTRVLALEAYLQAFPMDDGAAAVANLPALIENAAKIENASTVEAANAYKTAGFVYAKQARYDDALAQYNAALLLFNKTDDSYNRVVVLENRAKVERIQGHNRTALADVEAAIPLAHQNQDSRGELALEVERGAIAYASGQLGLAYEANLRAIALAAASHDDFLEGIAWSDQGMVATELHNFEEAAHDFDHADAIWNHAPNAYGQIQTREDQAEMRLAKGDLQGAQAIFAEGVDEAAKSSLDREQVFFLRGLAVSEMRSTKLTEAEQHLDQAIEKAERIQVADELSAIYASKGDLDAAQSHWSDAKAHWQRADALALQRGDTLDHVIALGGLVRAALELGDSRAASEHCQAAMSALESIRAGISDADLRLSFFASRHALYDLCVQTEIRSGDPQAAFDAAERGRARSLLDQAAASGVQAELPSSLLDAINDNSDQLRQLRERISKKAHNTSQAKLGDENAALLRARDQLRIQAQQSGLSDALAAASLPLNEREVRAELDPQTAVLAYWLGDKSSRVWCITRPRSVFESIGLGCCFACKNQTLHDSVACACLFASW